MKFSLDNLPSLKQVLSELATGLTKLSFSDNFRGYTIQTTVTAATELAIRNQLTNRIPSGFLILKQTGNALVTSGSTTWTKDFIYIQNHDAANDAVIKIFVFE